MFKRSRRKIVAAIMSILVVLWVGTLAVIYGSSYLEMRSRNARMLQTHAQRYAPFGAIEPMPPGRPGPGMGEDTPMFQLSTFYTVVLTPEGEVLEVQNDRPGLHSDQELESLSREILAGSAATGTKHNLIFCRVEKPGYTLVAFMDNTLLKESATTLFRHTLLFGGLALVVFFFLSVFLARKIVKPLEESYQKQKQFISDAGHELKTPVSVVSANAELLARQLGDNQWLGNIQYENQRMAVLVGQLLELARTENVTPQMEKLDFSRLVAGESLPFESVAFEKGLTLQSHIQPGISLEGNGTQLRQLVSILLDNAIRHSDGQGQVTLTLTREHNRVRLAVANPGTEIPPEQRQQIFERFYRVDDARNGEDRHYGLGLAIAKAVVTAHKGTIEVLCDRDLVEFRVVLPGS